MNLKKYDALSYELRAAIGEKAASGCGSEFQKEIIKGYAISRFGVISPNKVKRITDSIKKTIEELQAVIE